MLRLRSCILTRLLSSPIASPVPPLHRLLSAAAAAPTASPNPSFAAVDYLVGTCGLTPAQALKASTKLSHFKSPTNPDAVLTFLADLGLSIPDVAAAVAKDPQLLCASMEKILAPNVAGLTGLGLSHTEIACLVSLIPSSFRRRSIVSNLQYRLLLYGSYENILPLIKRCSSLLMSSLEKVVKPNVPFLRECGLDACDITKMCITVPRILGTKPEQVRAMAMRVEAVGVPRGSGMFRQAMRAVAFLGLGEEKIAAQVEFLKSTFRWSDAEVGIAVSKHPLLLRRSKAILHNKLEFLISEVGLEPAYIAHRPAMLSYSLEGRLRPRYYVVKFLKENALLDHDRDYYAAVVVTEKVLLVKYIYPHKEVVSHLAEDYADACRGEALTSFVST